jgi:putative phage-type endonuclease
MSHEAQWHAERRKGIGASDAPSVCGIRQRPTRLEIWLEKRGEIEPDPPNEAMKWGLKLEPLIAEAYTERTGNLIDATQISVTHELFPWMRATMDAVTTDAKLVEFKAVGRWSGSKLPNDGDCEGLPESWVIQGQHQMEVFGASFVDFAVFVDMSLRVYRLERNNAMLADIISLEREFWALVESGTPPAEFAPEDAEVLRRHFNRETGEHRILGRDYEKVIEAFKEGEEDVKRIEATISEAKARLLFMMGNASTAECGPYTLKRKLVNVKERTQTIKASQYIRFTCSNGEDE